jgi:hypothetical protein
VQAVLALHRTQEFAGFGVEHRRFELGNHLPAGEPPEIAATVLGARVLRMLGRELREVTACLGDPQHAIGLELDLGTLVGVGEGGSRNRMWRRACSPVVNRACSS